MIIITFNHHSFPVSQEPTRSNTESFEYFLMTRSGTTFWSNWNNMQHIKTCSNWTVTAVCRYCDNDVSLFSLKWCRNNWHCDLGSVKGYISIAILWTQKGELMRDLQGLSRVTPSAVEPVVNNSVSLKHWLHSDFEVASNLAWRCMWQGTKNTTSSPEHLKPLQFVSSRSSPLLWPPFDLWSSSWRRRFLDLIYLQYFVCFFISSSFSSYPC